MYFVSVDSPMVSEDFFVVDPPRAETHSNICWLLLLLWMKDLNQWILSSPVMGNLSFQSQVAQHAGTPVVLISCLYLSHLLAFLFHFGKYSIWSQLKRKTHEVFKPTAMHSKSPINVDVLVGLSKLSLLISCEGKVLLSPLS